MLKLSVRFNFPFIIVIWEVARNRTLHGLQWLKLVHTGNWHRLNHITCVGFSYTTKLHQIVVQLSQWYAVTSWKFVSRLDHSLKVRICDAACDYEFLLFAAQTNSVVCSAVISANLLRASCSKILSAKLLIVFSPSSIRTKTWMYLN